MNSPAAQRTIQAVNHLTPDGSVVDSARALATEIAGQVKAGASVTVDFRGIRGATTSYFNMLLRDLLQSLGHTTLEQRVAFSFASALQSELFDRSRKAVTEQP